MMRELGGNFTRDVLGRDLYAFLNPRQAKLVAQSFETAAMGHMVWIVDMARELTVPRSRLFFFNLETITFFSF